MLRWLAKACYHELTAWASPIRQMRWFAIDWSHVKKPDNREIGQAFSDGVFTVEDRHLPGMWHIGQTLGGGNIGHSFDVDGTDEVSLTQALVHGRKLLTEYEQYFKKYLTGYEDMELAASCSRSSSSKPVARSLPVN